MEELKIIAFEQSVVDLCNHTPIPNRTKMYVLKEIANKLLEASERDYQMALQALEQKKKEDAEKAETEQKGGGE